VDLFGAGLQEGEVCWVDDAGGRYGGERGGCGVGVGDVELIHLSGLARGAGGGLRGIPIIELLVGGY